MAMLKLDLRGNENNGRKTVSGTCAPVKCSQCTCLVRRTFHRCLECSVKSLTISGKPIDFCPDCFAVKGRLPEIHTEHHFLASDASAETLTDITWVACSNPLSYNSRQRLDSENRLLREMQFRELSAADYEVLMSLDQK